MSDGPPVPACPYCRSLQAERYRGWAVIVAVCDGCGKLYTYSLDGEEAPSARQTAARTPADRPGGP